MELYSRVLNWLTKLKRTFHSSTTTITSHHQNTITRHHTPSHHHAPSHTITPSHRHTRFLLAGFDTSSVCLTWTLHLLSKHTDVQKKLADEVLSVIGRDKLPTCIFSFSLLYLLINLIFFPSQLRTLIRCLTFTKCFGNLFVCTLLFLL
jgi:Cytochrome P450